MRSPASTMSYLELLKLALPEVIVVISALVVLAIGLTGRQRTAVAGVSSAKPPTKAAGTAAAATDWCSLAAALGVGIAIAAVLMLPRNASLFSGMLVITPLTSLFKIICLVLAFFTVCLARSEKSLRHPGEYLTIILLVTDGLMLLVSSEELLMIFIGHKLLGLSLYVMAAFYKTNVRRFLAYSAVAHADYTLIVLVAEGRNVLSAKLFYATVYAITLVGAFGVVTVVRSETGGDDVKNFSELAAREPLLAGCMAIFMFSLAGIPPLAGFFGKFYLFSAALRAGGDHGLLWLVGLALFGSFVSLYYYLIVLKAIFVDQPSASAPPRDHVSSDLLQRRAVAALAGIVLLLGIMPDILAARILGAMY